MSSNPISNQFTFKRLRDQLRGEHLSWLAFYDDKTKISSKAKIQRLVVIRESTIDDYTYVGHNSNILRVSIGKFCSVSRYANIGLSSHPVYAISTSPVFFSANNALGLKWTDKETFDDRPDPVTIGNDVWIGMNVTVTGGVIIGNGAIIAAHSVVTKDVPPYSIVAGVPAKVIKYRFDEQTIEKLQSLCWWDLPEHFLKKHIGFFQGETSLHKLNELNKYIELDII